jgi:glycosyltransferase involved in cell wall biosynthesis
VTEVLIVIKDAGGRGGMERQSEQMIRRLLEAGHRVTVVCRSNELAPHERLEVVHVPCPLRPASLALPLFFVLAGALVARHRRGLVHSTGAIIPNRVDLSTVHYCHTVGVNAVAGSRARRTSRSYRLNSAVTDWLSVAFERWCYRPSRVRRLVPVSTGVEAELRAHFPGVPVSTVPNGVDADVFRPDPAARAALRARVGARPETRLALFAGGDWERKGLRFAVDAVTRTPGWELVVAGDGDPAPHARDGVHFLGRVDDMPPVYAGADAFVFPTAYEAFPLVVLEAAASGLPVVSGRVNGVVDLIEDGVSGFLVERDGRAIADRLARVTPEMGVRAREAALRYSWAAMGEGYLQVYRELAG